MTTLLDTNSFVIVLALDFSKAFDTVRHSTLMQKVAKLRMPDSIYNWILEFLADHSHCTKHDHETSSFIAINASVIQGSALGPAAFSINAADLRPRCDGNILLKFADDTYLIIPARRASDRLIELDNVRSWAVRNNLRLNDAKSSEIIFSRPGRRRNDSDAPELLAGITRVEELKILGVTITNKLSVSKHVSETISACAQSLFALKTLRAHGMSDSALQTVFKSVVISKLIYASPAWSGFLLAVDRERVDSFVRKSIKARFYSTAEPTFQELCAASDQRLFHALSSNTAHVLHHLLPPRTSAVYNLRPRRHNFTLPARTSSATDCNFIMRMLYDKH